VINFYFQRDSVRRLKSFRNVKELFGGAGRNPKSVSWTHVDQCKI